MKNWILSVAILIPLSTGMKPGGPDPTEVEITISHQGTVSGEILAVRDSSVVMATRCGLSESELLENPNQIVVISNARIVMVRVPGTSHVVMGMGVGLVLGSVTGCLIGYSKEVNVQPKKNDIFGCQAESEEETEKEGNAANGALIGALAGTAVGAAVGASIGEREKVYIAPEGPRDFGMLKSLARYNVEPEFLRVIGPRTKLGW